MNLSRRSLLTGLLSSAAVIAAGPVAKVIPADDNFGIGPAMQFEHYTSHFRWNPGATIDDWRYAVRIANIGGNVLEGGIDDEAAHEWKVQWGPSDVRFAA